MVIEMPDLKGRRKLGDVPLYAQVQKEGRLMCWGSVSRC